jgi:hypothetical protein
MDTHPREELKLSVPIWWPMELYQRKKLLPLAMDPNAHWRLIKRLKDEQSTEGLM